ncbi:MAG: anaerobic glycerol-3-phosphate dehydrogenase subunit A [Selenomonadaceae bacterium]|nr:anaerobic glycerol-3-phosphate dehydrogenase subunit A [Selenomonadaceae bacterium]
MEKYTVVIIGGGATGLGILRDLAMRGVKALLVEKKDLVNGASSRYHGLLHSGGRYVVKDRDAAKECITENQIMRRIGKSCVEPCGGMFTRLDIDDEDYEEQWVKGCNETGIDITPITIDEAINLEPRLNRKRLRSVYLIPDAAIDGFRMAWQLVDSAKRYGGEFRTYTEFVGLDQVNGELHGVMVRNQFTGEIYEIGCDIAVNAAGGWAGFVGERAGLKIGVQPDKGTLIAFNQRIVSHVVNRLHKSSDGDIFVPHGSITILGTSSISIPNPEDTSTSREEVESLIKIGEQTFENLRDFRILRAFAGARPLYIPEGGELGRNASRGFAILDHETDGLKGFFTIVGGKFTTFRLMAEKICDQICAKLDVQEPCRTAEVPIVEEVPQAEKERAKKFFPSYGVELAAERLGVEKFRRVVARMESDPESRELVCECENITRAEVEEIAKESTTYSVDDLRRRTRIGMGTCQGNFCTFRGTAVLNEMCEQSKDKDTLTHMRKFLQGRWKGIRPVLIGRTLREMQIKRAIYELSMNVTGGEPK